MPSPPEDLSARLEEFISRHGIMHERRGGSGMAGRIMALLMVSEEPILSSAQIARALQTSSGTVSINTRLLEQTGLIERMSLPGRRGAFFRTRPGAWRTIFAQIADDISVYRQMLVDVLSVLPPNRADRVQEAVEFYTFIEEELPALMERWREKVEGA